MGAGQHQVRSHQEARAAHGPVRTPDADDRRAQRRVRTRCPRPQVPRHRVLPRPAGPPSRIALRIFLGGTTAVTAIPGQTHREIGHRRGAGDDHAGFGRQGHPELQRDLVRRVGEPPEPPHEAVRHGSHGVQHLVERLLGPRYGPVAAAHPYQALVHLVDLHADETLAVLAHGHLDCTYLTVTHKRLQRSKLPDRQQVRRGCGRPCGQRCGRRYDLGFTCRSPGAARVVPP